MPIAVVLFDLDGTLVDSAPDLAGTANEMRAACGLDPLPFERLRPHAGSGARGMLGVALGVAPGEPRFAELRDEFHRLYERRMLEQAVRFAGIDAVLDALDDRRHPWGIVTNKALRFAQPMAQALGLWPRAAVLVGGDSTPFTKPHPAPLLEAARRVGRAAHECVYVGDDARDMHAGRAAGMRVAAAAWGYLGTGAPPHAWGADQVMAEPADLLKWLEMA